jgi:hypothetical protein
MKPLSVRDQGRNEDARTKYNHAPLLRKARLKAYN